VAQVSQDGAARFDPFDPIQCLLEMAVGRMWRVAQGIDDPGIDALMGSESFFRY